jgi:hypothetical protein
MPSSVRWTTTIPVRISAPPTSCSGRGSSASSSHATTTANSTSDSDTNDAVRDPSRTTPLMPVR